jgi:hypothetical protein
MDFDKSSILGLPINEAQNIAERNGFWIRAIRIDDHPIDMLSATAQGFSERRINVSLKDNRIDEVLNEW